MSRPHIFPLSSDYRCAPGKAEVADPLNDACEAAGDPATLIGLALAYVSHGSMPGVEVPQLIVDRLGIHAQHGNAACRMVLNWLGRRSAMAGDAETTAFADDTVLEGRMAHSPARCRSQQNRVMAALAATAPPDPALDPAKPQRGLRRKRREPLVAIISATTPVSDKETSHG